MKPVWFIQENIRTDAANHQKMVYAIQEQEMEVLSAKYIPFSEEGGEGAMDWSFLPLDRPVIMQGGIGSIKDAQKRSKAYPLAWCNWDLLECKSYYKELRDFIVQEDYGFYSVNDVPKLKDELYDRYAEDNTIFIKPNTNDKEFTGALVEKERFDTWWGWSTAYSAPSDSLVVVSRPRRILEEWRFVVVDGKVVIGSQYMVMGNLCPDEEYPPEAAAFAEKVFNTWTPHPALVVDVGKLQSGELRLIEIGGVNCAGYYRGNIRPVVEALSNLAERQWEKHANP